MAGLIEELKIHNIFKVCTTWVVPAPAWSLPLFFAWARASLITPEGIQTGLLNHDLASLAMEPGKT